jgi:hypothetical protein
LFVCWLLRAASSGLEAVAQGSTLKFDVILVSRNPVELLLLPLKRKAIRRVV